MTSRSSAVMPLPSRRGGPVAMAVIGVGPQSLIVRGTEADLSDRSQIAPTFALSESAANRQLLVAKPSLHRACAKQVTDVTRFLPAEIPSVARRLHLRSANRRFP